MRAWWSQQGSLIREQIRGEEVSSERCLGSVVFFRYRVVPTGTPWMASAYSFGAQPDSFNYSPFLNSFNGVL